MPHIVGPEGQVVIEKWIRDRLGIGPGWRSVQSVVGNHVEIFFVPPEHNDSLFGCLAEHARDVEPPTEEEIDEAVARGIAEEWAAKERACLLDDDPDRSG